MHRPEPEHPRRRGAVPNHEISMNLGLLTLLSGPQSRSNWLQSFARFAERERREAKIRREKDREGASK